MPDFDSVLTDASQLSVEDQLRLIEALASSTPEDQPPPLTNEWIEEIGQRRREIEAGSVSTEEWSTIRARLFAKHGVRDERTSGEGARGPILNARD
ncbi:addiction module protein [Rubinisphaera margarita]|uniref:addiction module protein n=1 Tax=Rubinisphaera margarita TaxID=2909586 RepID=UPI001EE88975|nr:addiction module protein [Rubinisphaera margarita]MCG6158490.1 addiction module protein [Rubinisphaera margarita]